MKAVITKQTNTPYKWKWQVGNARGYCRTQKGAIRATKYYADRLRLNAKYKSEALEVEV